MRLALEDPDIWKDALRAQELGKKRRALEDIVVEFYRIEKSLEDLCGLFALAAEEEDEGLLLALEKDLGRLEKEMDQQEFRKMFFLAEDPKNAFLEVHAGSGGTEAQDWAEMLLRVYIRWAERHGFEVEILERQEGETAGIKSATLKISGPYAYGYLRTEMGVHRLVRKSPFDAGGRRHTSFAAVTVLPEVDEEIEVSINPADLRIDTYRASGAGGQHVNRTDSAVRITHLPTGIVVQCQNDRSQHRNRAQAMAMLKSRLFELEKKKQEEKKDAIEASKDEIAWGNQIRSYVLDQSRIKDLRTGVEVGNTQAVLDGDLDAFILESLKKGV